MFLCVKLSPNTKDTQQLAGQILNIKKQTERIWFCCQFHVTFHIVRHESCVPFRALFARFIIFVFVSHEFVVIPFCCSICGDGAEPAETVCVFY